VASKVQRAGRRNKQRVNAGAAIDVLVERVKDERVVVVGAGERAPNWHGDLQVGAWALKASAWKTTLRARLAEILDPAQLHRGIAATHCNSDLAAGKRKKVPPSHAIRVLQLQWLG
jgi:hypothetical protein